MGHLRSLANLRNPNFELSNDDDDDDDERFSIWSIIYNYNDIMNAQAVVEFLDIIDFSQT